MMEIYDPNIEVVICFIREAAGEKADIDGYPIKTRPTPRDAAEQE